MREAAGVTERREPEFFQPLAKASRDARRIEVKQGDATRPSSVWTQPDRLNGQEVEAMVVILRTRGCRWALGGGCTFCGYVNDSFIRKIEGGELVQQFEHALEKHDGEPIIKIYTSGSFFDPYEVSEDAQREILALVPGSVRKLNVEAQAVDVTPERVAGAAPALHDGCKLEVGVGLESASYDVAKFSVNKEFYFEDYVEAAETAAAHGVTLKAYTMVKPPFLTEAEAVQDCVETARRAGPHSSTVSFNPMNIQKNTLVDDLYRRREYRPPWLWSVVEILRRSSGVTDTVVKSDPVAGGKIRGAHNCGECDDEVLEAIFAFNVTQDPATFDGLACDCRDVWLDALELEGFAQGAWRDPRDALRG